jgi:O-antigen ligase
MKMASTTGLFTRSGASAAEKLLLLGLYGFAFALLLGRSNFEPALYATALGAGAVLVARADDLRPSRPLLAALAFGAVFLVQGWAAADGPIAGKFHIALGWAMVLAAAVTLAPRGIGPRFGHPAVAAVLLVLFVVIQATAYELRIHRAIRSPNPEAVALFSNMHYLALYAAMTLPILYYLALNMRSAWRWVLGLALAGDFWLLMQTHSRPGYMALIAAAAVTVPFLAGRLRLAVLAAVVGIPALLYLSGAFGFAARLDDFFIHLAQEERAAVWRETWMLQEASSPKQWWLGHGMGRFFHDYQAVSSFHALDRDHSSPHNHFLDLLYSHGIIGLILFVLAYGLLYAKLAGVILRSRDVARRRFGILLVSVTTAHLIMGFFTIPFFSRHNILPFGLILGADLWGIRWISENDE